MKKLKYVLLLFIVILTSLAVIYRQDIREMRALYAYSSSFKDDVIDENFRSLYKQYNSVTSSRAGEIWDLVTEKRERTLPETFQYNGTSVAVKELLNRTQTTGFIVLRDGKIVHESYDRGNEAESHAIMMSVSKSLAALLVGIAVEEKRIKSLDDPVTDYVPKLKGTAFEGVTIQQTLDMSTGLRWRERYDDLSSEAVRSVVAVLTDTQDRFATLIPRQDAPGTYRRYASINTHVLGMVLRSVYGKPYAQIFSEKLWGRIGAEGAVFLLTDTAGEPIVYGGLNIRLRDLSRVGLMVLNDGKTARGEPVVPASWLPQSRKPDAPHLMPGANSSISDNPLGYKNQWWFPLQGADGDFSAIGIYGQYLYINPKRNIVIAKTSAYRDYNKHRTAINLETLAMFQAIAAHLKPDL